MLPFTDVITLKIKCSPSSIYSQWYNRTSQQIGTFSNDPIHAIYRLDLGKLSAAVRSYHELLLHSSPSKISYRNNSSFNTLTYYEIRCFHWTDFFQLNYSHIGKHVQIYETSILNYFSTTPVMHFNKVFLLGITVKGHCELWQDLSKRYCRVNNQLRHRLDL